MKRLFLAVDLSITVVEELIVLQDELRGAIAALDEPFEVRWVDAPNIHLTLKFLGPTELSMFPMFEDAVEQLASPLFPFEVECRNLECFPTPDAPRIIYADLDKKGGEVLGLLEQALQRDLGELGVKQDTRPYRPHITLGRVKSRKSPSMTDIISAYEGIKFGRSYIKDIALFESILDHRGPRYEVIRRFALGSV